MPSLPPSLLPRPNNLCAIKEVVLANIHKPMVVTGTPSKIGVQGMGGIGKSVLAAMLARDEEIRGAFPEGIFWITVGQEPALTVRQSQLGEALGNPPRVLEDIQQGRAYLQGLLADKTCLLILDDVWQVEHVQAFDALGPHGRMLLTTRDAGMITALGAVEYQLDVLSNAQALALLAKWTGQTITTLPSEARDVARECGNLPLALALSGAQVQDGTLWKDLLAALREADLQFLDHPHGSIVKSLKVSIDSLPQDQHERYLELGVFPANEAVLETAIVTLWGHTGGLEERYVRRLITTLERKALLRLEGKAPQRRIALHDLQHDFLRAAHKDWAALHTKLVEAYRSKCTDGWSTGPNDGYFFEHLTYHLVQSGYKAKLCQLLIDFAWMQSKLEATNPLALITDYDYVADANLLSHIQGAMWLSAHVIAMDPTQLASQLLGRLPTDASPEITALRQQMEQWQGAPWLRPFLPLLTAPGGALLFTLIGHSARVRAVVVTIDGRRAISASDDCTIKIWDLVRGVEERTLTGHADWVRAIAVTPNALWAVSASDDHTLKLWNLETGAIELTIDTYGDWIRALAITPDGRSVISVSDDRLLKIWNLERGTVEHILKGHSAEVNALAITSDGRFLISGSDDRTLRLWDLDQNTVVQVLKGHKARITAVTITPDGRNAISASADDTLRIWDLKQSQGPPTFSIVPQVYRVRGLAVTPEGRHVITASEDYTLRIWNLEQRQEERMLEGHTDWVNAVAVTSDGYYAVSASDDHSLKVWDLRRATERRTLRVHTDRVRAVVVTADGRYALSTSDDWTLRVWNMALGVAERTFIDHDHWAITVTPDSRWVISAAGDATIRVWDLVSGVPQRTFTQHTDRIRAVTVTPDGRYVVSAGDDRTIRVWDMIAGVEKLRIDTKVHWIRGLAVTPDGQHILSASDSRTLKLWDLSQGTEEQTFRGHTARVNAVAIMPNGRYAVSASDDYTLRVWHIEKGIEERRLAEHTAQVNAVAITGDGRYVISASTDHTLKVWDWEQETVIATFSGESPLLTCAVSLRDKTIVAGDQYGLVHFLCLEGVSEGA